MSLQKIRNTNTEGPGSLNRDCSPAFPPHRKHSPSSCFITVTSSSFLLLQCWITLLFQTAYRHPSWRNGNLSSLPLLQNSFKYCSINFYFKTHKIKYLNIYMNINTGQLTRLSVLKRSRLKKSLFSYPCLYIQKINIVWIFVIVNLLISVTAERNNNSLFNIPVFHFIYKNHQHQISQCFCIFF